MLQPFFFQPLSPRTFGYYRIAIGLVALLLCVLLYPGLYLVFGQNGLVIWDVTDALANPLQPTLGRLHHLIGTETIHADHLLYGFFWLYVLVLTLFTLGWKTPWLAGLAWLMHLTVMNTCRFGSYGVESMLNIALFYSIFFPCGEALSLDSKGKTGIPSAHSRVSLRVLQIQLCIIYAASGIEKSLGAEWWNGNAIWYSLMEEQFRQFNFSWIARYPLLPKIMGWWTLLIECGYIVFIWWRPTARFWLINVLLMHLGIFVFMGLHTFAIIMMALNLTAFGYLLRRPVNTQTDILAKTSLSPQLTG